MGAEHRRLLTGWGGTPATVAEVRRPRTAADLALPAGGRGLIARGLGRSYGDAAQNAGGVVVDMNGLDGIEWLDAGTGVLRAGAGTSLAAVLEATVPRGWFPAVLPGTRHVTVGGAIAADIHGKNHHVDGGFCRHVRAMTLLTPTGERRTLTPDDDDFWATAGGMGLTGIVLDAELQLLPITSSRLAVDTERAADLDDLLGRMATGDHRYRYSVAWVDLLARGRALGRAVLTRANHAPAAAVERGDPLAYDPKTLIGVPRLVPSGLLNRLTVRAFDELWFRRAPRHRIGELQSIPQYFHPLDAVRHWNRLYGPAGFVQYQFVVPDGAVEELAAIVARLSAARCPSFLTVLKRFGPQHGYLSFPLAGWTLTLDVPARFGPLPGLLTELDRAVADCGGRVYLAKDSRLDAAMFRAMYPQLDDWQERRAKLDPQGIMRSDLARRLGMVS